MAPTCPDSPVLKEKDPFWANAQQRKEARSALGKVLKESEAWWVLLVAPSCLIGVTENSSFTRDLWGHTLEGYGETAAEFLASNERFLTGLLFGILKENPSLRLKVVKALLKEKVDGIALENQKLYETLASD